MQTKYTQKNDILQKNSANTAESVVDTSSQSATLQRHASLADGVAQRAEAPRPNNTGMPDNLKAGIESLSGFSMDDVRVHYNSPKPATVQALAYTQGTDIHVAPGQEKHLPHEAWHVAQQMAGRVSPTTNINGMPVNDNAALEHEADVMGEKAVTQRMNANSMSEKKCELSSHTIQMEQRDDPSGSAKCYSKSQGVKDVTMKFNRDHIIPHSLLKSFCEKYEPFTGSWHDAAMRAYNESKPNCGEKFFWDMDHRDKNAFCWMPGNIFLAPCPKADDDGKNFDKTFASAFGVTNEAVNLYKSAYNDVDAAVEDTNRNTKIVKMYKAKHSLNEIASRFSSIWRFDSNNWLYDPRNDRSYAKKIVDSNGTIINNPRIGDADKLLGKNESDVKRSLFAMDKANKKIWRSDESSCWTNAKNLKTSLKEFIQKSEKELNDLKNENIDGLEMSAYKEDIEKLKKSREGLGKSMCAYRLAMNPKEAYWKQQQSDEEIEKLNLEVTNTEKTLKEVKESIVNHKIKIGRSKKDQERINEDNSMSDSGLEFFDIFQ